MLLTYNKQTAYGPSTEERSGEQTVSDLQGKPQLQSNREMASKRVKMKFPDQVNSRKVVDNLENYLDMKFQTKTFTRSRDIAEKPHFSTKNAYKKFFGFLTENRALSLLFPYDALTSCQKAKKSLEPLLRKVHIN